MRSSAISRTAFALAGMAALFTQGAVAQDKAALALMDALPSCAIQCTVPLVNISGFGTADALCDIADRDCICNSKQFQGAATTCISKECSIKDSLIARNATTSSCGVPKRDASYKMLISTSVFSALSGFFVVQRFGVKIFSPDLLLGLDDWMVLVAALVQAPCAAIVCIAGSQNGLGRDIWTLTPKQITNFAYYLYIYTTIYVVNIAICKLAFLLFYLRVFPAPKVRSILWGTVGFVCVYGLVFLFVNAFQCDPISHYWHRWDGEHEGTCMNASIIIWAHAALSITLDLWNVAIPVYQLKGVNLDWKKKLGVGLMFSVGLFTTVISVVRLVGLIEHDWASPNQSWVKLDLAIWSTIEVNCAIICACLPAFRSLLVRLFPFLPLGMATHRDRTHDKAEDFVTGNRDLGFGTISRSVAEKTNSKHMPIIPGAIAMSRTYKVETETMRPIGYRGSGSTDQRDLMHLPSLEEFNSSESTLDGRQGH